MKQLNLFEQIHSSSVLSTMNTNEKVTHHTNITASILTALVDGGLFEYGEADIEKVTDDYAHLHRLLEDVSEDDYDYVYDGIFADIEGAYERLSEAMENSADGRCGTGYICMEDYISDVYYWYGINSVIANETPLSYHEFIKACDNVLVRYNNTKF